jgi:bifunctional non-homologous end joining protein LigD
VKDESNAARSVDSEGIVVPSFDLLHSRDYDKEVSLCAFDLLELSATDVRKQPLVERKEFLADFLANVKGGIEFNNHVEGSRRARGFRSRCKRGHDGIVAKRKDLPYESGRSKR